MNTTTYWLRLTLHRRWVPLVALTLVVAIASGTVLALAAGARRGGSAWDRFVTEGKAAHALVSPVRVQPDYDKVRALPYVEGVVETPFANLFITDPATNPPVQVVFTSKGPFDDTMEKVFIVEGRSADQTNPGEAVVSERFVRETGRGVGSTITTLVPAKGFGQFAGSVVPEGFVPKGQRVLLDVVGVARVPALATAFGIDTAWVLPTQGYWTKHGAAIEGSTAVQDGSSPDANGVRVGALVRLKGGAADIPRLSRDISALNTAQSREQGAPPSGQGAPAAAQQTADITNMVAEAESTRATIRFERLAVWALALGAGLAALVVVGLLVARRSRTLTVDAGRLAPIGLTRGSLAAMGSTPLVVVGVIGALLGAALSVLASPLFPIGLSRYVEPTPGVQADATVLVVGAVLTVLIVVLIATAAAWRASVGNAVTTTRVRLGTRGWASAIPSLPTTIGARRATSLTGPGSAGPLWLAPAIGVLGIVAAATLATGVFDATHDSTLYSPGPSAGISFGFGNQIYLPSSVIEKKLRASKAPADADRIAGTFDVRFATATVDGQPLNVGDVGPKTDRPDRPVLEGRLPDAPGEIALGPGSAEELGAGVGDTLVLNGGLAGSKPIDFSVVGIALSDWQGNTSYSQIGMVSPQSFDDLFGDTFGLTYKLVVFKPGTDAAAWTNEFSRVNQAYDYADPIEQPRAIINLGRLAALPWVLGAFLAFLGVVGLAGGLASSQYAARKGHAVLRSLGFTRRQSRASIEWEGAVAALVATAVGIPLGIAIGRALWRSISLAVPVAYAPPSIDGLVFVVVATTVLIALLLALVPAWRAGRLRVPELLRGE